MIFLYHHVIRLYNFQYGLKPIGPRAGVIYSWLFKYIQQHTARFTEDSTGPAPPKALR